MGTSLKEFGFSNGEAASNEILLKAGHQCHFAVSFQVFTEWLLPRTRQETVKAKCNPTPLKTNF